MFISAEIFPIINIGCLIFLLICILIGIKRGFLLQLANLAGMIVSFIFAFMFAPILAKQIRLFPSSLIDFGYDFLNELIYPYINQLAWFVVIVVLIKIVILILKPIIKMVQKLPVLKQCNELFGGILGGVQALLWIMVLSVVLRLPFFANGNEIVENTIIRMPALIIEIGMEKMPIDSGQIEDVAKILDNLLSENKDGMLSEEEIQKIGHVLNEEQVEALLKWLNESKNKSE